jgi:DMSO/TMAO reductase YedYZ molybdopterin-dependent catalytic subunit
VTDTTNNSAAAPAPEPEPETKARPVAPSEAETAELKPLVEAIPPQPAEAPPEPLTPDREIVSRKRRELLKLSPLVVMGAFLIPKARESVLTRGVAVADWMSGAYFSRSRLAPTFADSAVVPFERFPYNGYDAIDPGVDLDAWTLTVEGQVAHPGTYTLAQIHGLPKITQNTRHVCVEGWDAIGNFGGARLADFLQLVGADTHARFLEFECADDYYESLDMASAMHPQSLLCYEMYGKPLDRGHGAPVRLQMPTKLGYKQAKYLTKFRVTNVLSGQTGYWEDQGYGWFGGL